MRVILCLLLSALCVLADKSGNNNRRTKPFIADAVGNTLPPPTNVPATVGSPINLLTPDKYEFYTFDESGELVKRLMTLEEIQAIVAAGEDSEGLVTFANDNQPTIAFNFSQPPFTKVHNVVTNVQNVLKAQMEAHKNKPLVQPTLDTPDVSDSWSLILPSIFGNTAVDITPEKSTSNFTPETVTIEENLNADDQENSLSKEGGSQISSSTTVQDNEDDDSITTPVESSQTITASPTSTSTTAKPVATKHTTTTVKPLSTTTIRKKLVTTTRPRTTTTKITTTKPSTTTTVKPTPTITTTTTTTTTTPTPTTTSTKSTTIKIKPTPIVLTTKEYISNDIPTSKPIPNFERISTFIPVSTVKYVTERTTKNPAESTKASFDYATTTKRSPSTTRKSPQPLSSTELPNLQVTDKTHTLAPFIHATSTKRSPPNTTKPPQPLSSTEVPNLHVTIKTQTLSTNKMDVTTVVKDSEVEKNKLTTITTQSVSPSTTAPSTEFLLLEEQGGLGAADNNMEDEDTVIPLFDVAQSISQIASDLGNNYQPIPTSSNLLDTNKVNVINMESKENVDMDIPNDEQNKKEDNFVKISTIDPHPQQKIKETDKKTENKSETEASTETVPTTEKEQLPTITSILSEGTTIDPILSGSMDDLLSQVVHEAPQPTLNPEVDNNKLATTEKQIKISSDTPSLISSDISTPKSILTTTQKNVVESEKEAVIKVTTEKEISVKTTTEKVTTIKLTTENKISDDVQSLKPEPEKITPEKTVSPEKDTNKISSLNNKVSVDEKPNENDDDSKDFVKISVSATTNSSNIENNKQNISDAKLIEKHDSLNKITASQKPNTNENKKEIIAEQKPTESTLEITTVPIVETTTKPAKLNNHKNKTTIVSQSNQNKFVAGEKNASFSKNDKIPENTQKIDEFKKKIQKVNDEEMANDRNDSWKLISTVTPPKSNDLLKEKFKPDAFINPGSDENKNIYLASSKKQEGLEVTTKDLSEDIAQFIELCHKLAFRYWNTIYKNIDKKRSFVFSPYSVTSMLAMIFMGARGATSGEMNEILKLDDMVTFNPHFTLKNISDSIEPEPNSGIAVSAFVRELFSDRNKGKILTFYKERALHFYSGHVEEINFKLISDIIRRRTNLLVKKHTLGKIPEYIKTNSIVMQPPLAAFSANVFQTDCTGTTVDGRDGEMYFVVSPNVRQRRLVPVPAVVYKSGFLAGYDPMLDATAAAFGSINSIVSTIFLMPGQPGDTAQDDDLQKLEDGLIFYSIQDEQDSENVTPFWNRILKSLHPRVGLELQIPRFSHKSVFNVSSTLREMGLKDMFDANHADLGGLNGPSKDLYLSDMIQMTSFATCGESMIGEQHHIEEYPETLSVARRRTSRWADWDEPRDYQRAFHDPHDVGEAMHLPLHLRPRQARVPTRSVQPARIKFDRPFLYFVRHNPTGMILYFGRYNPRLLP